MKFLDPKTDTAFKRLFGDKQRTNLTIDFLNNLLERKQGNLITEITFCDNSNISELIESKDSSVDINCVDQQGHHFIIEMQVKYEIYFLLRSQFYASFFLSNQLKKAQTYSKLKPVIFIGIMDKKLFEDNTQPITHHLICNTQTGQQTLGHLEFHYVELCHFHKTIDELTTEMDRWLYFFKHVEDLEFIPEQFAQSKNFKEAFHVLEKALWSREDLIKYRADQDKINELLRYQEGLEERGEQKEREKIAINLLKLVVDIDVIMNATNLSAEDIENIRKKMF